MRSGGVVRTGGFGLRILGHGGVGLSDCGVERFRFRAGRGLGELETRRRGLYRPEGCSC